MRQRNSQKQYASVEGEPISKSVAQELRQRYSLCGLDFLTAVRYPSKTLSSSLFLFFATLFSTVALGAHIQQETGNRVGLSEYLLSNSIGGAFHALFGAQPLLILRPTGPITAIMGKLSALADGMGYDFYLLLAATGVWVSFLMLLIAAFRLSTAAQRFTPFTLDIFACFVCSIYVFDGAHDVYRRLQLETMAQVGRSLLDLNLALVTFYVSVKLNGADRWKCCFPRLRSFLCDYAVTIAVVASTLCSFSIEVATDAVLRIDLPAHLGPSCELDAAGPAPSSAALGGACLAHLRDSGTMPDDLVTAATTPSVSRPWLVDLAALFTAGAGLWLTALAAAIPISFFFFFDQNISTLFCQRAPGGLDRGRYIHSAFVALGVCNLIGPLLGCPFLTGSLPHSPQFVRALTVPASSAASGGKPSSSSKTAPAADGADGADATDETEKAGAAVEVAESRVAPLLVYVLIGLPLLAPRLLLAIPGATIDGVLLFVGYEGVVGTDLFERTLMLITPKYEFNPKFHGLRKRRISLYTALQLLLFAMCWAINLSPAGLAVAFLIVALVPLRERVLPLLFAADELERLDGSHLFQPPAGGGAGSRTANHIEADIEGVAEAAAGGEAEAEADEEGDVEVAASDAPDSAAPPAPSTPPGAAALAATFD